MKSPLNQFLDTLRCPVCQGQIDQLSSKLKLRGFNYACGNNNDHYMLLVTLDSIIDRDVLRIHGDLHRYEIFKSYTYINGQEECITFLSIFKTDAEGRVIDAVRSEILTFESDIIPFKGQSVEQILNRIKTVLLFH